MYKISANVLIKKHLFTSQNNFEVKKNLTKTNKWVHKYKTFPQIMVKSPM